MATHSSIAWEIPWTEEPVQGMAKSETQLSDQNQHRIIPSHYECIDISSISSIVLLALVVDVKCISIFQATALGFYYSSYCLLICEFSNS